MGVFDQAARYATEEEPEAVVNRLFRGAAVRPRFHEWRDTRTTPRPGDPDRTADRVAALVDDNSPHPPWLLLAEFQSRHDPDKLDVTLVEAGQLRLRCRHGDDRQGKYKVLTALIYLCDTCPEPVLDMTLGGAGTRHKPLLWIVAEDNARETLEAVAGGSLTWGMLFWVPLMSGGGDPVVVERWKELASALPERRRRGDLALVVVVFAELAGCAPAWKQGLEGWDMTESAYVNSIIQGAYDRARLERAREDLQRVLRTRFPVALTPEVIATINEQPSLSVMDDWFEAALGAFSWEGFLAVLRR